MTRKLLLLVAIFTTLTNQTYGQTAYFGKVHLKGSSLPSDILKIEVLAEDIANPVLGVAFHLKFSENLKFLRYEPGDFLERGGDPTYLVTADESANSVIFGSTLKREDEFPVNDGRVAELYFEVKKGSQFQFKFDNEVISTINTVRQDLDNVIFEDAVIDIDEVEAISDVGKISNETNTSSWNSLYNRPLIFASLLLLSVVIYLGYNLRKKFMKSH